VPLHIDCAWVGQADGLRWLLVDSSIALWAQGGFGGVGMLVCKTQNHDEETEEVVVDGDDTATFGPTQYAESDVAAAAGAAEPSPQDQGNLTFSTSFSIVATRLIST